MAKYKLNNMREYAPDDEEKIIGSVDEALVCPGCGFISHITHGDICGECFQRRESWLGGGPLRVVTRSGTYHETPLCPSLRNVTAWCYWRDESCCYADLGGRMDKCVRCHSYRTFGFDEYVGDEERQVAIGHS